MAFNFDQAVSHSTRQMQQKALEAVVLGPSGAGKSYLLGTFGCPTLYLYSTGESHGPRAAHQASQSADSTIIPISFDLDDAGNKLEGDAALARIMEILDAEAFLDKYKIGAIAIDGAAEIENYIRASDSWEKQCRTAKGDHNTFAEPAVTCTMFRPIFNRLKDLQRRRGMHFAMTCMLDVKEYGEHNDIVEAVPRLKGYAVAEMLIQQFGDVLVVSAMKRDDERKWKLQFMSDITKTSKDLKQVVKRTINFSPRLNGIEPPAFMDANLAAVIKFKEQKT